MRLCRRGNVLSTLIYGALFLFLAGDVGVAGGGGEDSQSPTLPPAQAVLPFQQDPESAKRIHRFAGEQNKSACKIELLFSPPFTPLFAAADVLAATVLRIALYEGSSAAVR